MSAKHTPGPWFIHPSNSEEWSCHILSPNAPKWPYDTIASIREMYGENCTTPGAHSANARLIAAAPDLLEALQRIMPLALSGHFGGSDSTLDIEKARAAIAKATGGAA
jgi:hypothetical protein